MNLINKIIFSIITVTQLYASDESQLKSQLDNIVNLNQGSANVTEDCKDPVDKQLKAISGYFNFNFNNKCDDIKTLNIPKKDYDTFFNKFLTQEDQSVPNEYRNLITCKMLERNLKRDNRECFATPDDINNYSAKSVKEIRGKMKYLGKVPLPYKYDIVPDSDGKMKVKVKIHFRNANEKQLNFYKNSIQGAEQKWNLDNPFSDKFKFQFEIVDKKEDAHFSVKSVNRITRGPYCKRWDPYSFDTNQAAHEIGHMMGLDDEYQSLKDLVYPYKKYKNNAYYFSNPESLMEGVVFGKKFFPYHYYLILRRATCQ